MWKMLSYLVGGDNINWPGNPFYKWEPVVSMDKGSVCNTAEITVFDHLGTHIDAPRHYNANGPRLQDVPFFERFIFEKPLVVDVPKKAEEKIEPEDLKPFADKIKEADLLCIRTGFSSVRPKDADTYNAHGPAVSSRTAKWLIENFGGSLKAVALDFLSLACPQDTKDGDLAHQYMLGMHSKDYIMIIEDCNLSELPGTEDSDKIKRIYAIPLRFTGVDSGPVTMFAELKDEGAAGR